MNVTYLRQTRGNNCGQTVVAMLTGTSIAEVEKLYGNRSFTRIDEHRKQLESLGYKLGETREIKGAGTPYLPEVAIVRIGWLKRSGGKFSTTGKVKSTGHLVLWANGVFYDPAVGIMDNISPAARITHIIEVKNP